MSAPATISAAALRDAPPEAGGFPPRILAALRAAGLQSLGDALRAPPDLPRLDADDRALLGRIADWGRRALADGPEPLDAQRWLDLFLVPRHADAIRLHYALSDPTASLALHERKLRDTGFKLGVTRERARQILRDAHAALAAPLPQFAAAPLYAAARDAIAAAGGLVDGAARARNADAAWGGAAPVGVVLMLSRLAPARIAVYRDLFTLHSPAAVERIELALRDRLSAAGQLLPIRDLAAALSPPLQPAADAPRLLAPQLRHLPDALAARDGRAGLAARDASEILREILAEEGESPLRILLDAFNARVHPECRRGSGFLRDVLRRDPLVRGAAPGRYVLPGGLQTRLPL